MAHGYPKLFGGEGKAPPPFMTAVFGPNFPKAMEAGGPKAFAGHLATMGVPFPETSAYVSGAAEFGGGLALLTGVMTRWAALVVAVNMAVAISKVHWKNGLAGEGGFSYPAQLFAESVALFLAGPGAFSIDGLFGGIKAGGEAVSQGTEAIGKAAAKAQRRGSRALGNVAAQAQALPRPF
jgi:uncharacterized membrane protein YphA (DoxX/SURF4 family)